MCDKNRLNDTQETMLISAEDSSRILDMGCTKAMRSRSAFHRMKAGLDDQNTEILPDASTFNFANGHRAAKMRTGEVY